MIDMKYPKDGFVDDYENTHNSYTRSLFRTPGVDASRKSF